MGNHSHRKHSEGLNGARINEIISSITGFNGQDPDFTLRKVPGTREGIRKGALAAVDQFLRGGGELPVPSIDNPRDIGRISLSFIDSADIE